MLAGPPSSAPAATVEQAAASRRRQERDGRHAAAELAGMEARGEAPNPFQHFNAIDEATLVTHPTSRFASAKEKVQHDSYLNEATRHARRVRQVAGHMPLDWQYFRTMLADERNIMAWTRTFLKLSSFTWTVLHIPTYQAYSFFDSPLDQALGLVCMFVAVLCMHLGRTRYIAWNNTLDFPESHLRGSNNLGWQLYFLMGLFIFLAIALVSRNILDSHFASHNHNAHNGSLVP